MYNEEPCSLSIVDAPSGLVVVLDVFEDEMLLQQFEEALVGLRAQTESVSNVREKIRGVSSPFAVAGSRTEDKSARESVPRPMPADEVGQPLTRISVLGVDISSIVSISG